MDLNIKRVISCYHMLYDVTNKHLTEKKMEVKNMIHCIAGMNFGFSCFMHIGRGSVKGTPSKQTNKHLT